MSGLAVDALRIGLIVCAGAALSDWLYAAIGGLGAGTQLEGLALAALAAAGGLRPRAAARWLLPPGHVAILAALLALVGAIDPGFQVHYAQVAPTVVFVAALVSSPRWVLVALAVSIAGYLADVWIAGHSLHWMFVGAGQSAIGTQVADLALNALVGLLLIALLRRFVRRVPETLAGARDGSLALPPGLALAVRPQLALPRADPAELIEPLSPAEVTVLDLLADGRAPKQAAYELSLALPTVRSHIAAAKRKTGARTLEQLVADYAEGSLGG